MKAPGSFMDTTEVFANVAGVLEYFQEVFKLKSSDKLILAETAIPGNHLFVDAPGIVIFDKQSIGDRIPVDLLSYSLGHQYFGLLIPENPGPAYTTFLSEGFQSYFETLYTRHYRDDDALSKRWAELHELYFMMVDSVGYQRLDQPEIEFEIHRAFTRVKAALVLEMLRTSMDKDAHFVSALRHYVSDNKNMITGLAEFEQACENASERDWTGFLDAWVSSKGLPKYTLEVNRIDKETDGYTAGIAVTITGNPAPMPVQVRFRFDSRDDETMVADFRDVTQEERDAEGGLTRELSFTVPAQPSEITLDPENRILKDLASTLLWKAAGSNGQ
jgi:hypothetical protein